ncbi:SsgA family sporulation/cell division regulator [Streptomyces sp. 8N616]|uniref:SsgA family sporulation/cell division regulator n=1 Tax=Streptomyces sp. 8N616 TaxID=3457414 RepID=UPI003FD347D8
MHILELDLDLMLVLSHERAVPIPARLAYRRDDPYAVQITFHVGSDSPVRWTFARELLIEGVFRPCGEGDVRVRPTKVDGRSAVSMALSSPGGSALIEAPAAALSAWLELTVRAVAPGSEHEWLDVDDALAALLAPALPDDQLRDGSPEDA